MSEDNAKTVIGEEIEVLRSWYRTAIYQNREGLAGRVISPAIKHLEYFLALLEEENEDDKT